MVLLRILGVLVVIAIGAGIVAFLFTRDSRYLALSWRITKYALIFALIILSLFFLERVVAAL